MSEKDYTLAEKLEWPFPPEMVELVDKGYGKFSYVPVSEVIVRLNKVLGVGNWGMTVDSLEPLDGWLICRVTLRVFFKGEWVLYGAAGGHKIEKDTGDTAKSAVSDAFKKAASLLGIGLYLSRTPEALAYERERKQRLESHDNESE
jgi:hypothetical protein